MAWDSMCGQWAVLGTTTTAVDPHRGAIYDSTPRSQSPLISQMPRTPVLDRLTEYYEAVLQHEATDEIHGCPAATLHLLPIDPAALIKLAHTKVHCYPFSQVPTRWRRLFTDASICEAIRLTRAGIGSVNGEGGGSSGEETNEQWIRDVVKLLDMAIIMAGAPERANMIEDLLATLQSWSEGNDRQPPAKRRKLEARFSNLKDSRLPTVEHAIPRRSALSLRDFENHLPSRSPIVITGALKHWPALDSRPWNSPFYLMKKTFDGRRLVPVEIGRSYTDEGWGQTIMTFREFMEKYMLSSKASGEGDEDSIAYLAQHDLFSHIPSLRNDISIPDYCYSDPPSPEDGTPLSKKPTQPKMDEPLLNAWFGPGGTVTPLHTDPYHNILCQVVGRKYVRVYSPYESENLYPRSSGENGIDMSNTSQVEVEGKAKDQDADFPLFRKAKYSETILGEGELLYIPVGWWHYVRSLEASFSVSFWWN